MYYFHYFQETEAYSLYNKALTLLRHGRVEEAEDTFRDLIDNDFLVEVSCVSIYEPRDVISNNVAF